MTAAVTSPDLTPREREVLEAVSEHRTNAEIAARLFLSVRTVESHVASLLRKTGASSRRELAVLATPGPAPDVVPLTPFIGRRAEQDALATAVRTHRLVTALGPGGVGKTRLALAVAARERGDWAGGVTYADLVPVSDPARLPYSVAAVLGVPEQPGRPLVDSIAARLGASETLLVLDNCEHVADAAAGFLERLLAAASHTHVLATSRVRLALPFEWTFPVPGLSVEDAGGDAVQLFLERAVAAGADPATLDPARVAAVCRALDGLALAIELAAARVHAIGLDGLEAGLGHRLDLLAGDRRVDGRHRSLRAMLDWSATLLDPEGQAVLRRSAVFTTSFRPADAAELAGGWAPVTAARVPSILADLADSSLMEARAAASGTRMRMLETVRQYGLEQLEAAGETAVVHDRHLAWCGTEIEARATMSDQPGDHDHDLVLVAMDVRAAIGRRWRDPSRRAAAFDVAKRFGDLLFTHGRPGEAQRAYERAVELAPGDDERIDVLDRAAGAAESRHFGDDALRLHRATADASLAAGHRGIATWHLARSAELLGRNPGTIAHLPPPGTIRALVEEATEIGADGDPLAAVRLRIAELYVEEGDLERSHDAILGIVEAAREAGDVYGESAALDALCATQLIDGRLTAAAASAARRLELLAQVPPRAAGGMEHPDALGMATECALSVGDLTGAQRAADRWATAPEHSAEPYLGLSRPISVATLRGDLTHAAAMAVRFVDGWERAGRPGASNLAVCAAAGAAAHDLTGDPVQAARLRAMVQALVPEPGADPLRHAQFDALALLHAGRADAAVSRLAARPESGRTWFNGLWRPWYAAAWAEAGVLAGVDGAERLARARPLVAENPVAAALLDRAAALHDGGDLGGIADRLERLGAAYQAARTRVLAGGTLARRGAADLETAGIVPMTWPTGGVGGSSPIRAE